MARETFQISDLTAVIGDNEGYEGHRAGYNGVHRLTHRTNPKSLFTVTGLNLEHILDGDQDLRGDRTVTFEPRNAPMTFTKISGSEAELHQPPTPTFHLEILMFDRRTEFVSRIRRVAVGLPRRPR